MRSDCLKSNRWTVHRSLQVTLIAACATCVVAPFTWAYDQALPGPPEPMSTTDQGTVVGFTAPLETVTLAALQPGRISEMPAAEGEQIEAGQPAVHLDDTVQRQRLKIAKAQAESTIEVDLARVRKEHAAREFERIESLVASSAASPKELSDARAEVQAADLEYQQACFKHAQDVLEFGLQEALCDQMHIRAPFTGYVSAHLKKTGDSVEEREGILSLVQLDPLLVAIDCPIELAPRVRRGQTVNIVPFDAGQPVRYGEIFFVNRVADPASQTFKVKIKVSNADLAWMAGMRVRVVLRADAVAETHSDDVHDTPGREANCEYLRR